MSKQIITKFFINDKNKDDVPFKTKKGEPFSKVTIKVAVDPKNPQEWDDKYISGLSFNPTDACLSWEVGDEVDLAMEKNNEFWNFKTPSKLDLLESRVKILEAFMRDGGESSKIDNFDFKESNPSKLPEIEDGEDIPF